MSKYYGESERLFGKVFSLANELPDGAIIFLDEVPDTMLKSSYSACGIRSKRTGKSIYYMYPPSLSNRSHLLLGHFLGI